MISRTSSLPTLDISRRAIPALLQPRFTPSPPNARAGSLLAARRAREHTGLQHSRYKQRKKDLLVFFFGSGTYGWIIPANVKVVCVCVWVWVM